MKAWMMKNTNENFLIPSSGAHSRTECVNNFVAKCDWYESPTWKQLRKDGFRPVKVEIAEIG